jgi:SAM-dependent methyltransferase
MKIAKRCVCCDHPDLDRVPAVLAPFVAARVFGWQPVDITPEWGLRDIGLGHAYSICNTLACRSCGHVFLDMRFDAEEMAALYEDYRGPDYCAARERFEPGYSARNDSLRKGSDYLEAVEAFLEPHVGLTPRVLDWGGDTGLNTPFRRGAALHHVYDISQKATIEGATLVSLERAKASTYDVVVSMQVFEHLASPRDALAEIAAVMRPETLFYLEVPHEELMRLVGAPEERARRKRHWHEHVSFFTEASIGALLASARLEVVERVTLPVQAGGKEGYVFSTLARLRR